NPQAVVGSSPNPFRFAGAFLDSETGLCQMRGRYYDPSFGRFLTQDVNPGNPYSYCRNNPTSMSDPSGWMYMDPVHAYTGGWESSYCKILYARSPGGGVTAVASFFPTGEFIGFMGWDDIESNAPGWGVCYMQRYLPKDEEKTMAAFQKAGIVWSWSYHRGFGYPFAEDLLDFERFENNFISYTASDYDAGYASFKQAFAIANLSGFFFLKTGILGGFLAASIVLVGRFAKEILDWQELVILTQRLDDPNYSSSSQVNYLIDIYY
ncbi:MAG: RHS repeat-associated core domain-containing protein, partial [Deltaproteobacteria bacterium]